MSSNREPAIAQAMQRHGGSHRTVRNVPAPAVALEAPAADPAVSEDATPAEPKRDPEIA